MPTALGNTELVLKPGIVCNRCNNGVLSQLDQGLCDFGPVALMRVQLGIAGRSGKLPTAKFGNAHLIRHENDHIVIDCKNDRPAMTTPNAKAPTQHRLQLEGRKMTEAYSRDLVRGLYKVALGFVAYDHGMAFATSDRFDEARAMILGQKRFGGYLAVMRHSTSHGSAHFTYQFIEVNGIPTMSIHADLYGVQMLTDLDSRRIFDHSKVDLDQVSLMEFAAA